MYVLLLQVVHSMGSDSDSVQNWYGVSGRVFMSVVVEL